MIDTYANHEVEPNKTSPFAFYRRFKAGPNRIPHAPTVATSSGFGIPFHRHRGPIGAVARNAICRRQLNGWVARATWGATNIRFPVLALSVPVFVLFLVSSHVR